MSLYSVDHETVPDILPATSERSMVDQSSVECAGMLMNCHCQRLGIMDGERRDRDLPGRDSGRLLRWIVAAVDGDGAACADREHHEILCLLQHHQNRSQLFWKRKWFKN